MAQWITNPTSTHEAAGSIPGPAQRVMALVSSSGWSIGNADITIALQRPKLAPYIVPMRECLAGIMGISPDRVSVKATTTEKLGFVGRGEGCEVYAVVLLTKE